MIYELYDERQENPKFYSSPREVVISAGIKPSDLGFETTSSISLYSNANEDQDLEGHERLNEYIKNCLKEAMAYIDGFCHTSFIDETPENIHGVARDIVTNIIKNARLNRNLPLSTNAEYPQVIEYKIFTNDIEKRLKEYVVLPQSENKNITFLNPIAEKKRSKRKGVI